MTGVVSLASETHASLKMLYEVWILPGLIWFLFRLFRS